MYSPKIRVDLIPLLYRLARHEGKPMTHLVDEILRVEVERRLRVAGEQSITDSIESLKKLLTNGELKSCLAGKKFLLDCGHRFCLHPWSNTLVLTASGKSSCHNCYE